MDITFLQAFKLGFAAALGAITAVTLSSIIYWTLYYVVLILTTYRVPIGG